MGYFATPGVYAGIAAECLSVLGKARMLGQGNRVLLSRKSKTATVKKAVKK